MKTGTTLLLVVALGLLSGCVTVPVPTVADQYRPVAGGPTLAFSFVDEREDQTVGTVGLAIVQTGDILDYAETVFLNALNRAGANVSRARAATAAEMDALRAPILVEVRLLKLHFFSIDALLDAADGEAVAEVRVHELGRGITMSRKFVANNTMRVAWPILSNNYRIVEDLVSKLAEKVTADPEFRARTLL